MENNINKELELLSSAIEWVNTHLQGERQHKSYDKLVKDRRELKKIRYALSENPAAVLYGESQKGKSYLVGSLLSAGGSFTIKDTVKDRKYDFIADINPRGNGTESTGVVTRFTTRPGQPLEGFPIRIKLLSITDMILVLCDGYWNNVNDQEQCDEGKVASRIEKLQSKLKSTVQKFIEEDDIMEIGSYFESHFKAQTTNLRHYGNEGLSYFRELSIIIDRLAIEDWKEAFSILWNDNEQINNLFSILVKQYQTIDFVNEVCAPFEVILRDDEKNKGYAIIDVARLNELFESSKTLSVKYRFGGRVETKDIKSSYLSVLAAEVILQLPEDLAQEKKFLNTTDILDFPGARREDKYKEDQIFCGETDGDKIILRMLLRGKVAYLFNKYANNYMINTLLLCHDQVQTAQGGIPELLGNWIDNVIGKDSNQREDFIRDSKISPLFVISTKFNQDLEFDPVNDRNPDNMSLRWQARFNNLFEGELVGGYGKWVNEWTTTNKYFNNFYLLRDYVHAAGKVFEGWTADGCKEEREIPVPSYPDFREKLRKSFIDHDFVKKHFDDPAMSWDEAASLNKDGSELIIKNLTKVSEHINQATKNDFKKKLNGILNGIIETISEFYHSESSDENLRKAKEKAGEIAATLHINYAEPYFFGTFVQNLMIPEAKVNEIVHDYFLQGGNKENKAEDMSKYAYIWMHTPQLSVNNTFEDNLNILCRGYSLSSPEACKAFFEEKGINLEKLFSGAGYVTIDRAHELSVILRDFWLDEWLGKIQHEKLTEKMDVTYVDDLRVLFANLYQKNGLAILMENRIRKYIDRDQDFSIVTDLISDMCAEMINRFVSTVGYDFISGSEQQALKEANEQQDLGLRFDIVSAKYQQVSSIEGVADILTKICNVGTISTSDDVDKMKILPGTLEKNRWAEYLKIGFVQTQNIPNYDVEANAELGKIINNCRTISF